jgi:squalene synthase HpnC
MSLTQFGSASSHQSGKGRHDENFPVASLLLAPGRRGPILAFYRFARIADDVADHPTLAPEEKLRLLDRMEAALDGVEAREPEAAALQDILSERGLSDVHARLLLSAFRQDATVKRTHSWLELMDYCAHSAMPVGRFVLDVHGEPRVTHAASDAICAALQIINHLQDCGRDYRALDRVYIPLDMLAHNGACVEDLARDKASPALRKTIADLALRADQLLDAGEALAPLLSDRHLAREVEVIVALARANVARLRAEDPLQGGGRTSKPRAIFIGLATLLRSLARPCPSLQRGAAHDAGA